MIDEEKFNTLKKEHETVVVPGYYVVHYSNDGCYSDRTMIKAKNVEEAVHRFMRQRQRRNEYITKVVPLEVKVK